MSVGLVVGCPVWDRAWCLDAWFDCLEANVSPADTALIFCVPASDQATRDVITRRSGPFAAVEVLRDQKSNLGRGDRIAQRHETLAVARNRILEVVNRIRPEHFLSWDSDFFVPRGTVDALQVSGHAAVRGVWGWLNRQPPQRLTVGNMDTEFLYQQPMAGTAMEWDPQNPVRARHFPATDWPSITRDCFLTDVVLGFQLMDRRAFMVGRYNLHPDDEHMPFFWSLMQRGLTVECHGDITGVHLYDRHADEPHTWPQLLALAREIPLAAHPRAEKRSMEHRALGLFPVDEYGE